MITNPRTLLPGATIEGIFGLVLFMKVIDAEPLALWLKLAEDRGIRVSCASDGESIALDSHFPWPFDMQNDGAFVLVDKSYEVPWNLVKGAKVAAGMDVISANSKLVMGIGLRMEAGHSLYLLNLGDKLCVLSSLDERLVQSEALFLQQW